MTVLGVASIEGFALLGVITIVAAMVQRLSGQGFGTIMAGFVTLVAPTMAPVAILILGLSVTAAGAGLDFKAIRWREIAPAAAGRLLGTIPAVWVVSIIAGSSLLGLSVGLVVLLGVVLSLFGLRAPRNVWTMLTAGGLSGFFATLTSVGAAPMSLIYQDEEAKAARGTLNLFFLLGLIFSLVGLASKGLITTTHGLFALSLAPFVLVGVVLAGRFAKRMEGAPLRPLALFLASFAAIILIKNSVF